MRKLAMYGFALSTFAISQYANAVTCTSVAAGGNWNATGTWTGCTGGNGTPANTPGSADTAIIATTGVSNVTVNVTVTVGALTINSSGTGGLVASRNLTVNGATQLQAGNLNLSNNATRTFVGLVTVSGGTWSGTNRAVTFRGGLTVSGGTFTPGTGVHTFSTNAQAISGTVSIPSVTVTGVTLTNNGTLTVGTALAGTGGLTQGASDTLNIGGTITITTLTATATDNTVNYTGAAQTVKATTYYNLATSGSGNKTPATGTVTITGNFTIGTGTTWLGSTNNPAVTFNPTVPALATFTNSGTFTSGTGLYTFSGSVPILIAATTLAFTGSVTISNTDTVSGVTIRPTITITVTLTVGAGSIMTLGDGTTTTTPCPTAVTRTFNATSTVVYDGTNGAQTVAAATYGNLTLSGGGNKTPAAGKAHPSSKNL
jgi:hypothetical protein